MGVCCIVFDIDGMLFEFFMNFLNIEKNKITFWGVVGVVGVGGGGEWIFFFLEKQFFLISRFMLFSTLKKIFKSAPSLTG